MSRNSMTTDSESTQTTLREEMEARGWRPPTEHARINTYALRCFRDTADADYIAARAAMRGRLGGPFLWSALHAVEKYLKGILMLNRASTHALKHDIGKALERINAELPFQIVLDGSDKQLFDHLSHWGGDRYLLQSIELFDIELLQLDHLVWKLRQYCQPLDVIHYADEPTRQVLIDNVAKIEARATVPAQAGHVPGGFLEQVLADRKHAARPALIWKNLFFCTAPRKRVLFRRGFQTINGPLFVDPEMAEQVAQCMYVPKPILEGARLLAQERRCDPRTYPDN